MRPSPTMAKDRSMMQQEWIQTSNRLPELVRVDHSEASDSIHLVMPSGLNLAVEKGLPEGSRDKMEILMTCLRSSNSFSQWAESLVQRHVAQAQQLEGKPKERILMYKTPTSYLNFYYIG